MCTSSEQIACCRSCLSWRRVQEREGELVQQGGIADEASRHALRADHWHVLCAAGTHRQPSERRTALVVGNAAYEVGGRLRNPVNDATDVAQTLREVGFDATLLTNAMRRQIRDGVETLRGQLTSGGVGVFYYAGHGTHVQGGHNYLIPLGAPITSETDIEDQGVSTEWIMAKAPSGSWPRWEMPVMR